MNIFGVIDKKRKGESLTKEEMEYAFLGYLNGVVADYQMSSLLMAIVINGMTEEETTILTDIFLNSGEVIGKDAIKGIRVDKHSTGGVGDKTSMIIGPILASLDLKIGKLSGKGLGITGGTIDKLDSIPGFNTKLTTKEFIRAVNKVGFAECMQTDEFTPLDKVIYSLRSASATVESIPLIAASIMSKKLATGAKYILIDIKVGEGALIKNKKDANDLANLVVKIGENYDRKVIPVLTDMSMPLGDNVGNALEVIEAMDILKGKTGTLTDLCINLSTILVKEAKGLSVNKARKEVKAALESGKAYEKFLEFVKNQGGDIDKLEVSKYIKPVKSKKRGKLSFISAEKCGNLSLKLGAGRINKEDEINYGVGVVINKHLNDNIKEGDILCYIYQDDKIDYTKEALDIFEIN